MDLTSVMDLVQPIRGDGSALHHSVPAKKWCVTKADLQKFRQIVMVAVASKKITPTDLDKFSLEDTEIGPCVHTICHQLIKPLTAEAGGMSWALMLHPDGLECDVFVTHGWAEGIYEFLDKVLNSWPKAAQNAYCCMLSNPQNLDISDLIASPGESPFAKALACSSHMLVVPNQAGSIYSRVWCAYEAFLGYKQEKIIFMATPPIQQQKRKVLGTLFVSAATFVIVTMTCLLVGFEVASDASPDDLLMMCNVSIAVALVALLAAATVKPGLSTRIFVFLAAICGAIDAAGSFYRATLGKEGHYFTFELLVDALLGCGLCASAAAAEFDRLNRLQDIEQSKQLRKGYTGTLRDAQASVEADRSAIIGELSTSGVENDVDEAIHVLLEAGMSTPTLRKASSHVGRLQEAGRFSVSMAVLAWTAMMYVPMWHIADMIESRRFVHGQGFCSDGDENLWNCENLVFDVDVVGMELVKQWSAWCSSLDREGNPPGCIAPWQTPGLYFACFGALDGLIWLMVMAKTEKDKRSFAARVSSRIMAVLTFLLVWPAFLFFGIEIDENPMVLVLYFLIYPAIICLMIAGPGRACDLPIIGPLIVRYMFRVKSTTKEVVEPSFEVQVQEVSVQLQAVCV